ncbi:TetR/AcrR family transcriptional regulator [Streptomyces sp. NBC_00198]|uniref:TetR/AcrR family transcriptional regulator n=1 Tax=Streptomyces sp. NBC_00198 TaxID=2975677 RepID=UPI00225ACD72|nr:TetR/AcrR family transcriptional regulator [Streptomyces sp. NBC_00198]MCX5283910.1 TetR/AcrR family transcriptional regulator [Streptomyces sp. NBC_00198]
MRQERSERTRRNLVGAASTVFDQSGYERATLSAISERAQVTKGALSFHFAAKADLARAVQADACAVSGAALAEIARRETPAFEIATAMTHAVVRLVESDALVRAGARLTQEIRTPDDPALHVHLNWLGALHGALRRAKADGSLLSNVDVPAAASLLLSLITGTTTLPHLTGRGTSPTYWGHRPPREPGDRRHERGDHRPEPGDHRPEPGDRRPGWGDLRPELGDHRPGSGNLRPELGDLRPESAKLRPESGDRRPLSEDRPYASGDRPYEWENGRLERGDRPYEWGEGAREAGDRPRETGDQWLTRTLHLIRPALSHLRPTL